MPKLTLKQETFMHHLFWSHKLTETNSMEAIEHAMKAADVKEHIRYNWRAAFLWRLIKSGALTIRINFNVWQIDNQVKVEEPPTDSDNTWEGK